SYLMSQDYIVGQESENKLALSTSETYSFIVYSFGTKVKLPELNLKKGENINTAILQLKAITDVMMDVRMSMKLSLGENNLGLILKHLFTEVNVKLVTQDVGKIETISNMKIS